MRKNNIEKEVKIISVMIMLVGLSLLILNIYSVYCVGKIQDLSDIYYLVFGSLLIVAGFGIYKYRNWARKMILYTMVIHLFAGIIDLCRSIEILLPPKIDNMNIDYHLSIEPILVIVVAFVIGTVLPAVGVFYFLNKREIKELFQKKQLIANQMDNPLLSCEKEI